MTPSWLVMPMVNRPVPELKAGWPSASALKEPDFVSFAMMFAVYASGSYIGTIGGPVQAFRSSMSMVSKRGNRPAAEATQPRSKRPVTKLLQERLSPTRAGSSSAARPASKPLV